MNMDQDVWFTVEHQWKMNADRRLERLPFCTITEAPGTNCPQISVYEQVAALVRLLEARAEVTQLTLETARS
jgi:hypothetical protein